MTTTTEAIPQHMAALARGNELRMASAEIRREIGALPRAEALRRVADLLECPPMPIQRTRVDLREPSAPAAPSAFSKRGARLDSRICRILMDEAAIQLKLLPQRTPPELELWEIFEELASAFESAACSQQPPLRAGEL